MRRGWLLGLLVAPSLAVAEGWGGMAGVVSDYAWHGQSLSDQRPSAQADIHYAGEPGWFAGSGLALVRRAGGGQAATEISPYLGAYLALDQSWHARLTLVHYTYAGDHAGSYDYDEAELRLGFRQRLAFSLSASPNTRASAEQTYYAWQQAYTRAYGRRGAAYAADVSASQPLRSGLAAVAGIGYRNLEQSADLSYGYWSAGLEYVHGPWVVDLSRIGTSDAARRLCCGSEAVNRWVGSLFRYF